MEKDMITRINRYRLEAVKRQAQTRKHRRFESDEAIVTAQEIVDAYFPRDSVLVKDWGIGGKQFAISLNDDESAVAILTDEDGYVSWNAISDTRNADVIHEEWRTMRDVEKSGWF